MSATTTTYSFQDLTGSINFPLTGMIVFDGAGIGDITVSMSGDKTAHDVAADGSVMVSKVLGNNGTITINCQQTSILHKSLLASYNALLIANASDWARAALLIRSVGDGTSHVARGVSFQKLGDKGYQAQGQRVSWTLMCAEIHSLSM